MEEEEEEEDNEQRQIRTRIQAVGCIAEKIVFCFFVIASSVKLCCVNIV